MEIIKATNLSKIYQTGESPVYALKAVNLAIEEGSFVAVTGPSGSGKSTLLHILGGLDKPSEGTVQYRDKDLYQYNDNQLSVLRRRRFGFVFQSYNLLPRLTAIENIIVSMEISKVKVKNKKQKALELMKSVGLSEPYQDHIVILFDAPNEGLIKELRGYFDYDHPKDLPDGGTQIPVIEGELSKALAKIGLEMGGGFDYVPNEEAAKADYSNWLKDNPRPVDPTSDSRWRSRSYYDRTKGSGAREYAKFKDDYAVWKEKYNNAKGGFAPQHLPGMYFSVQRLGQSDEIAAFYAGSNWWGD